MKAQEYSVFIPDGPNLTVDSLSVKPSFLPLPAFPQIPQISNPSALAMPLFETKEQRAARINGQTFTSVMESVDKYLLWYRPPKLTKPWKQILGAARLFLSNPNGFPDGCVPLMNSSFPFIYAKVPGMAPYDNPYTSDLFPKCIDSEYDAATGTYKQVMVDWAEVQSKLSDSNVRFSSK